jgi:Ser-tRNA(Ala) deacylase AlaX
MPTPAFHREPYRRHLTTDVLACRGEGDRWLAVTADTLLFPGGGGQPGDHGTIAGQPVTEVLADADGGWLHVVALPVAPGSVEIALDWPRRFDHMQQHSAQHLITALAQDQFGLATLAFHLGAERSSVDLDAATLPPDLCRELQAFVNAEIRRAVPIRARTLAAGEVPGDTVRSRGLPEGHVGPVRIVTIEGIDANTCGGTHVASTAELQVVQFLGTERVHGGITRLHYAAGGRALVLLEDGMAREQQIGRLLSCAPAAQPEAVVRLQAEAHALERQVRAVREELALALGAGLAHAAGEGVGALHRDEDDLRFLQAVASAACRLAPAALFLLTAQKPESTFLLAGPAAEVAALGPCLCELLEARGGGARGRFQGRAQRLDRREEALGLLRSRR